MTCRRKNTRQEMLKLLRKIHISMQGPDITIHTCVIERYIYHYLQMKGYFLSNFEDNIYPAIYFLFYLIIGHGKGKAEKSLVIAILSR